MIPLAKLRPFGIAAILAAAMAGCGSPPEEIRSKLLEIGRSDLEIILSDLPEKARRGAVLPSPRFVIDEYQEFQGDTALVFQAYASLVFLYLDPSLGLCQQRKYRYRRSARVWERYESVLRHFPARYAGGAIPDSLASYGTEKP